MKEIASDSQISFTFEDLFYHDFSEIIKDKLKDKRIFLSACNVANFEFARTLIPESKCYSIIGSPNKINFDKSSVFWSGFYHLMKEQNNARMGQPEIIREMQKLVNAYNIPINYYSFIRNNNKELKENLIRPRKKVKTTKRSIERNNNSI